MDTNTSQELEAWLEAVAHNDRYEVERTLKQTPDTTTEVVYRQADQTGARMGPFVRKRFFGNAGRGTAYLHLLQAQTAGARLDHQPFVYDYATEGDTLDVVMEYVHGKTLREHVRREGPGPEVVRAIGPDLCDAVSELHEALDRPIIHRDVKPSNVMLGKDRLVLIDLGIAREFRDDAACDTVRYGTPGYAPPEQFGFGQTSVQSDVYSLGMTLAYCLTGEDDVAALRESGFDRRNIPPRLRDVLTRATQFDPAARYATVRELKQDLEVALDGTTRRAPLLGIHIPHVVGRIWNALVLLTWAVFLVALFDGIPHPVKGLADTPLLVRVCMYLLVFVVDFTVVSYLLLDKRRLRERVAPLANRTWRQDLPLCLLIMFVSGIACVVIYAIAK